MNRRNFINSFTFFPLFAIARAVGKGKQSPKGFATIAKISVLYSSTKNKVNDNRLMKISAAILNDSSISKSDRNYVVNRIESDFARNKTLDFSGWKISITEGQIFYHMTTNAVSN